ncbi:radical SAM peptide maturase [Bacteroides uniformis]|nr:radical SAM peptide maturase [Bacteroides uniformis]
MEAITFKTELGNSYLYSPARKVVIPIPLYVHEDLLSGNLNNNYFLSILKKGGYFDNFNSDYSGRISEKNIETSIRDVSQVVFEMTTACNLQCEYCCYSDGYTIFQKRQNGKLEFSTAKVVLDYLARIFKSKIQTGLCSEPFAISFYGGEPLMNFPIIKEIVEYAELLNFEGKEIVFTMTTNAVLIDKYADFLSKHKFRILVSLDGNKKHDSYRKTVSGKNSFDIVYKNLKFIQKYYPALFSKIRFNAVYTDKSEVVDILNFFMAEFGKFPQFSQLHKPDLSAKEFNKIKSMYKEIEIPYELSMHKDLILESPIHKRIFEFCMKLSRHTYHNEGELSNNDISTLNYPTGTCVPFSKRIFVTFDGNLFPCEKINRDIPWGYVDSSGKMIINASDIAERFNSMLDKYERICSTCYLQQCCIKCAFQSTDFNCDNKKTKEQFRKMLSQIYSYIEKHPDIVNLLEENVVIK